MFAGDSKLRDSRFLPGTNVGTSSKGVCVKSMGKFGTFCPRRVGAGRMHPPMIVATLRVFGGRVPMKGGLLPGSLGRLRRLRLSCGRGTFDLLCTSLDCYAPGGGGCTCGLRKFSGS